MERKLTAIFSADVKGYSRLMGDNEEATIHTLTAYREVMTSLIQQHRGRVVDSPGDNLLAEFASAVDAVQGAVEIQHELQSRNVELPDERKMHYRIGINVGDVIIEGERLYGDGVNIAARLEGLAEPGGICISGTVYDQIENKLALNYAYVGEQEVKNIAKPVRVYRLMLEVPSPLAGEGQGEGTAREAGSSTFKAPSAKPRRVRPVYRWITAGLVLVVETISAIQYFSLLTPNPQPPTPSPQLPLSTQSSALITKEAQLPLPDKPSIAVLPFTNLSGDPEQEYFSDGITEDLTTALSKLAGLFVIARHSAFVYKGKTVKVKEVSQELGVRYVLEGSVRKADGRVRINAQLVDATTGGHLWAEQYDREYKDVFALQDEIRQKIVFALKVKLTPEEQERFRYFPTNNLDAYDAVLRGAEYFSRFTKEANAQARQWFERAIELDLQYAAAYAFLAFAELMEFVMQWNHDPHTLEGAFAMAQQAVTLDNSLPIAHIVVGEVHLWKREPEQAVAAVERAIALDPNFAEGYAHLGAILNSTGKPAEGLTMVEKAMRLSPHPPSVYFFWLGESHLRLEHYEEAITAQKQALLRNPNFLPAHAMLADSYLTQWISMQTQDPQTLDWALESAQKVVTLNESFSWGHALLARVYLSKRQHAQAITEAERVIAFNPNEAESYAILAFILSYAGQPEKAVEVAAQARRLNPRLPGWYCFDLGRAYRLMGRMEEAITAQKEALTQDPNWSPPYYELAVIYSDVGREEDARATVSEYRRRAPHASLDLLQQTLPYKDPAVVEHMLAALRKAGLE